MSLFKGEIFSTFFNMKKVIILASLSLIGQNSWAQIRDFKTTRLMSTAGTGVASVLSTEAAILNPASAAFFTGSSFSWQSYRTSLKKENELRDSNGDQFPKNNLSQGLFMADNSGPIKGGVAYVSQDERNIERSRMVLHGAAPMGKSTAMGVTYNYIQDKFPKNSNDRHKVHHQASLGLTHVLDEDTILGLVVQDPTRTTPNEERAIAGFQYSLADRFTILGDVGAQFTKDVSQYYLWRAGVQMNVFADFYVRAGQFYDNIQKFKGTGWGVSWIGPRLGVEFAQMYSEQFDSGFMLYKDEKLVDTSLSVVIKF